MLAGILLGGVVTGFASLMVCLALDLGVIVAALGYMAGGMCGCLTAAALAIRRMDRDLS